MPYQPRAAVVFQQVPFLAWAAANGFRYPPDAVDFLGQCESPAEAHFAREFAAREGVTFDGLSAECNGLRLTLQNGIWHYRVDAIVARGDLQLAVELDGLSYHRQGQMQMARDYLRQRRIVCAGYTVIRFTAQEVFTNAGACWRQIETILARRDAGQMATRNQGSAAQLSKTRPQHEEETVPKT